LAIYYSRSGNLAGSSFGFSLEGYEGDSAGEASFTDLGEEVEEGTLRG